MIVGERPPHGQDKKGQGSNANRNDAISATIPKGRHLNRRRLIQTRISNECWYIDARAAQPACNGLHVACRGRLGHRDSREQGGRWRRAVLHACAQAQKREVTPRKRWEPWPRMASNAPLSPNLFRFRAEAPSNRPKESVGRDLAAMRRKCKQCNLRSRSCIATLACGLTSRRAVSRREATWGGTGRHGRGRAKPSSEGGQHAGGGERRRGRRRRKRRRIGGGGGRAPFKERMGERGPEGSNLKGHRPIVHSAAPTRHIEGRRSRQDRMSGALAQAVPCQGAQHRCLRCHM